MNITNSTVNIDNVNAYNNTTSIPSKVCTKCNQIKPLTEYCKNKSTLDGLHYSCKLCQSIISKLYRDKNKQINANKIYNENDVKICSKCKLNKPLKEYQKNIATVDGLHCLCKSCKSIEDKHYKDNNRQINSNKIYNENDIKTCYRCKQQKLYTEFFKNATFKSGLDAYCKECRKNGINEYFRQEFGISLKSAIKNNNNNYLSIMSCDSHFLKLWFEF